MPIIVTSSPFDSASGAGFIARENYVLDKTATHTTSGDANNITNWNENKRYSGSGGTIDIDLGELLTLEYFAVNGLLNASISLSDDGVTYADVGTIDCDKVALEAIPAQTHRYIRLTITGDFTIKVFAAGILDWIQPAQDGFTPPELSRNIKLQNEISQEGVFMGRTIIQEAAMFDMEFKNVSEGFAYNNMLRIQQHLEVAPIFMRWRDTAQPVFAWMDRDAKAASYNKLKYLNNTFKMRGVVEPLL